MIKPLIIDVKSGNILSLKNILSNINNDVVISNNEDEIKNCTHIFLPGVGNYSNVMEKLKKMINISFLKDQITNKKKPILGICVGMQIMSTSGEENGEHRGLGLIDGIVKKIGNGTKCKNSKPTIAVTKWPKKTFFGWANGLSGYP